MPYASYYAYACQLLWVLPFLIHHEVLTLSENVRKPLTLSENCLLKQRRKKVGPQRGNDVKYNKSES